MRTIPFAVFPGNCSVCLASSRRVPAPVLLAKSTSRISIIAVIGISEADIQYNRHNFTRQITFKFFNRDPGLLGVVPFVHLRFLRISRQFRLACPVLAVSRMRGTSGGTGFMAREWPVDTLARLPPRRPGQSIRCAPIREQG